MGGQSFSYLLNILPLHWCFCCYLCYGFLICFLCVCVCVLVQGGRGPGPSRPGQVSISLCTGVLLKHVLSVFVVIPLSSLCFAGQLVLEVMVSLYE